ncbi:MAG: hypothetical protein ACPHM6_08615, partial [Paracoccaceae bacterium]
QWFSLRTFRNRKAFYLVLKIHEKSRSESFNRLSHVPSPIVKIAPDIFPSASVPLSRQNSRINAGNALLEFCQYSLFS